MPFNPLTIIKEATKAVPAIRYAMGIAGIAAVVALVYSLSIDMRIAGWGVFILLILMTVLLLFAKLATLKGNIFVVPALFFLWCIILLFILTASFFVSSIFFKYPIDLSRMINYQISKDTSAVRPKPETIITDTLAKHVSVSLIEFEGQSLDYIIDSNSVPKLWKEWMGENPVIYMTSVLDTLNMFKKRFFSSANYLGKDRKVFTNSKDKTIYFAKPKKYLAGTDPNIGKSFSFYTTLKYAALLGFKIPPGYGMTVNDAPPIPLSKSLFNLFNSAKNNYDFKDCDYRCSSAFFRLYQYICRKNTPPDFMVIKPSSLDECGGECGIDAADSSTAIIDFSTPVLKMGAYQLKNNNSTEIVINNISLLTMSSDSLRYSDTSQFNLKNKESKIIAIHLKPGQSLIIPAYLYFHPMEDIKQSDELLDKNIWKEMRDGYVYGKEYMVDSITIGSQTIRPIRTAKNNLATLKYMGFTYSTLGSCPYIFSYCSSIKNFIQEGNLIYKMNSPEKKGWDTLKLKHFEGTIQIKEIDKEESFIDQLVVKYINQSGKESLIYPDNPLLKNMDNSYLHLRTGDKIIVRFPSNSKKALDSGTYYIYSYGYYIPK